MTALTHARTVFSRLYRSEFFVALLCAAWFVALLPFTPELAAPTNLGNIAASLLPLLILATGQTLVLVAGGIDLSMTAVIGLAGVVGGFAMNGDTGWFAGSTVAVPLGILAMLLVAALTGGLNGVAISRVNMPPFMVTLTSLMFVSGLAIWLTQSRPIANLPSAFLVVGADLAWATALTLVIVVGAHALLARTLFGRWLYAIGHNSRVALISGVPVRRVITTVYVLSAVCAALAAILYTGRLETASPVTGQRVLLDVIGATVIGGTSLYGGKGGIVGMIFGALFLTLIDNSLNLLNLSHFAIMMVKGAVILAAAWLDAARNRRTG